MKKIEIIWRELLFSALEGVKDEKKKPQRLSGAVSSFQTTQKKRRRFTQKELAKKFGFSTSTVFQALKVPRKMGAVRVTGRFFILEDAEKLLYHWASVRNLGKDILLSGQINLPIFEIEGRVPSDVVFGGYTAARYKLGESPADYDKVYLYTQDLNGIKKRFKLEKVAASRKRRGNLIVLKADQFLTSYGQATTLSQTFVDLWNLPEWYAKEFTKALKEKIDEALS